MSHKMTVDDFQAGFAACDALHRKGATCEARRKLKDLERDWHAQTGEHAPYDVIKIEREVTK